MNRPIGASRYVAEWRGHNGIIRDRTRAACKGPPQDAAQGVGPRRLEGASKDAAPGRAPGGRLGGFGAGNWLRGLDPKAIDAAVVDPVECLI